MTRAEGAQSPKAGVQVRSSWGSRPCPAQTQLQRACPWVCLASRAQGGAARGGWTGSATVPEAMGGSRCQPHTQHLTVQISVPVLLTRPQPGLPSRRASREAASTGSHVLTSPFHCSSPPPVLCGQGPICVVSALVPGTEWAPGQAPGRHSLSEGWGRTNE